MVQLFNGLMVLKAYLPAETALNPKTINPLNNQTSFWQ
jgi:hypothetical protein